MIKRIFVDNFRTLVNFEWKPQKLALLLGDNGSGKSSVADAIWGLRALITEQGEVRRWFPSTSRSRWERRFDQTLEMEVLLDGQSYLYKLTLEHSDDPNRSRVKRERLELGEQILMDFAQGELQLYRDSGGKGPVVGGDWSRSGLGAIAAGRDNKKLTVFKTWLREGIWFLHPDPRAMTSRTDDDDEMLAPDLSNFASWFPRVVSEDLAGAMRATDVLKEAIHGFCALQVSRVSPRLEAQFLLDDRRTYTVDFADLSDGQRQLCGLYFLRHTVLQPGRLAIFDEPDNYVALREIQPWLADVVDHCLSDSGPQVWFVSHHPELLNQLAPNYGTRFFRDRGPTRIEPFSGAAGLTASETIARGWDRE